MMPLKNQNQVSPKLSTKVQKITSNKDKAKALGDQLINALKKHRTEKEYK